MNFINKALEKAKSLHQRQEKPAPLPSPAPPGGPGPDLAETPFLGQAPDKIHYIYTRTAPVDMDRLRRNRLIVQGGDPAVGEAYKLLRTRLMQRTQGEGRNTLMFTGPLPQEGKTLTAINVALAISQKVGQTVLLVDADLRTPSVHRCLGLPSGPGLVDYLTSGYPIAESLVHPGGLANLVVLPAGAPSPQSAELLGSPLMMELVRELKHFYPGRYVLFDLPPLLYADPLAFAPLVDGIMVVVESGVTPREEISRTLALLQEFPVLGLVLNKIPPEFFSYGSGHRYYPARQSPKKFPLPWLK